MTVEGGGKGGLRGRRREGKGGRDEEERRKES